MYGLLRGDGLGGGGHGLRGLDLLLDDGRHLLNRSLLASILLFSSFSQLKYLDWLICVCLFWTSLMCVCERVLLWWRGRKNQGVCCQAGDLKVKWGRKSFGLELVSGWVKLSWAYRSRAGEVDTAFLHAQRWFASRYAQLCTIMRMGGIGQLDGWETPRDFA